MGLLKKSWGFLSAGLTVYLLAQMALKHLSTRKTDIDYEAEKAIIQQIIDDELAEHNSLFCKNCGADLELNAHFSCAASGESLCLGCSDLNAYIDVVSADEDVRIMSQNVIFYNPNFEENTQHLRDILIRKLGEISEEVRNSAKFSRTRKRSEKPAPAYIEQLIDDSKLDRHIEYNSLIAAIDKALEAKDEKSFMLLSEKYNSFIEQWGDDIYGI